MSERVLYSVIAGPPLNLIRVCANSGEKLHFVCRDDKGKLDEFDLRIVGELRDEGVEHELLFTARDSMGLIWNLSYDARDCSGNMFRIFQRS